MPSQFKYHGVSQKAMRPIPTAQGNVSGTDEQWTYLGGQWSAIEPADPSYRVDPVIVKAIREIDRDFVPLWRIMDYRSPNGGVVRAIQHAMAYRIRDPRKRHQERQILWPCNPAAINYGMGGFPVYVEEILEPVSGEPLSGFTPLAWQDYERIKHGIWWQANHMPKTPEEEAAQAERADAERKAKEEKRINDEMSYRFDHESKGVGRHLDQIGTADIQAWGAPREQSKPFVEVKHS